MIIELHYFFYYGNHCMTPLKCMANNMVQKVDKL